MPLGKEGYTEFQVQWTSWVREEQIVGDLALMDLLDQFEASQPSETNESDGWIIAWDPWSDLIRCLIVITVQYSRVASVQVI